MINQSKNLDKMQRTSAVFSWPNALQAHYQWSLTYFCQFREHNYHRKKHYYVIFIATKYTPYYLMVTGFLMFFYCNVDFIVTRCLAMCLGLPRFTGPTNKTKLESYWVHTSDEITICKRNKKKSSKRKKELKYCLMRVGTWMPRTFKNWTQHSQKGFNVWANSSGYQDKMCLYVSHSFVLRDLEDWL